jgi:hypothetical protein
MALYSIGEEVYYLKLLKTLITLRRVRTVIKIKNIQLLKAEKQHK